MAAKNNPYIKLTGPAFGTIEFAGNDEVRNQTKEWQREWEKLLDSIIEAIQKSANAAHDPKLTTIKENVRKLTTIKENVGSAFKTFTDLLKDASDDNHRRSLYRQFIKEGPIFPTVQRDDGGHTAYSLVRDFTQREEYDQVLGALIALFPAEIIAAPSTMKPITQKLSEDLNRHELNTLERQGEHSARLLLFDHNPKTQSFLELEEKQSKLEKKIEETHTLATKTNEKVSNIKTQEGAQVQLKHWDKVRSSNRWLAIGYGAISIALTAVGFLSVYYFYDDWLSKIDTFFMDECAKLFDKSHIKFAYFTVFSILGSVIYFWALRIFVRLALSANATRIDAAEREVFMSSYSDFEMSGKLSDEHRMLIFNSLFQSSNHNGASHPEPAKASPITWLVDQLMKKPSQ